MNYLLSLVSFALKSHKIHVKKLNIKVQILEGGENLC